MPSRRIATTVIRTNMNSCSITLNCYSVICGWCLVGLHKLRASQNTVSYFIWLCHFEVSNNLDQLWAR